MEKKMEEIERPATREFAFFNNRNCFDPRVVSDKHGIFEAMIEECFPKKMLDQVMRCTSSHFKLSGRLIEEHGNPKTKTPTKFGKFLVRSGKEKSIDQRFSQLTYASSNGDIASLISARIEKPNDTYMQKLKNAVTLPDFETFLVKMNERDGTFSVTEYNPVPFGNLDIKVHDKVEGYERGQLPPKKIALLKDVLMGGQLPPTLKLLKPRTEIQTSQGAEREV